MTHQPRQSNASAASLRPPSTSPAFLLDSSCRLSSSLLWSWQSSFYSSQGLACWRDGIVPNFVTSNRFIATKYAKIVLGFVNDIIMRHSETWNPCEPIYILELGAGHGRFSYLLLDALVELEMLWPRVEQLKKQKQKEKERRPSVSTTSTNSTASSIAATATAAASSQPPFVYVLTDFTAETQQFWMRHPNFQRFHKRGLVRFGIFNAEEPNDGIRLEDGTILTCSPGSDIGANSANAAGTTPAPRPGVIYNTNPVAVIGNYVFDSLRHDAFRLKPMRRNSIDDNEQSVDGADSKPDHDSTDQSGSNPSSSPSSSATSTFQLQESLLSLYSSQAYESDLTNPDLLKRFQPVWNHRTIHPTPTSHSASKDQSSHVYDYYHERDSDLSRMLNSVLSSMVQQFVAVANLEETALASARSRSKFSASTSGSSSTTTSSPPSPNGYGASSHTSAIGVTSQGFSFLFPIGALRCMQWIRRFSRGNFVFLIGDKAHTSIRELSNYRREAHIAIHGSCSMMVNLLACKEFIQHHSLTGASTWTPYLDGFKVAMMSQMRGAEHGMDESTKEMLTKMAATAGASSNSDLYHETFDSSSSSSSAPSLLSPLHSYLLPASTLAFHDLLYFNPDSFSTLQRCMKEESSSSLVSLKAIWNMVRLSSFDCEIFWKFRTHIIEQVTNHTAPTTAVATSTTNTVNQHISEKLLQDIRSDLVRLAQGWYPLHLPLSASSSSNSASTLTNLKDLSFELGRLAMGLHAYSLARTFFLRSLDECGPHHVTEYNLGLCRYYEGAYEAALQHFENGLELYPQYDEAREWSERMKIHLVATALHETNLHAKRIEPTLEQEVMRGVVQHQQQQQQQLLLQQQQQQQQQQGHHHSQSHNSQQPLYHQPPSQSQYSPYRHPSYPPPSTLPFPSTATSIHQQHQLHR